MEYTVHFLEAVPRTSFAISYRFQRPESFTFLAGQYILLNLGEKEHTRPLSLSECPEETDFLEISKRDTASPFCKRLQALKHGDEVRVTGPMGSFFADDTNRPLVLLAGGIGITPIRSLLKHLARKQSSRPITLIYGNENEDDMAFCPELEQLSLDNYHIVHVLHQPKASYTGYRGFITTDIIRDTVEAPEESFFMISGPPGMVTAMLEQLRGIDVNEKNLRTDVFLGYT